jgi:hypothetical protein
VTARVGPTVERVVHLVEHRVSRLRAEYGEVLMQPAIVIDHTG